MWTNPNPTKDFKPQKILIDLTNVKYLRIRNRYSTGDAFNYDTIIDISVIRQRINSSFIIYGITPTIGSTYCAIRLVNYYDDGLYFNDGFVGTPPDLSGYDAVAYPYEIYIK